MPKLNIQMMTVGYIQANCYIVWTDASQDAVIIDPGGGSSDIIGFIAQKKLNPIAIVNTHGHSDHIGANGVLKDEYHCPIMIHEDDADYLTNASLNLSMMIGFVSPSVSPPPDRLLKENDTIRVGDSALRVIHTPGHTPGSICLYDGHYLFTGDTLFAGGIGRTDFPGGSFDKLMASIKSKLLVLPNDTEVYPGHGTVTTIGIERSTNPFLL